MWLRRKKKADQFDVEILYNKDGTVKSFVVS